MDVFVANEQDIGIDETRSGDLARHALGLEDVGPEAELSILYVTRQHIRNLNKRFAGNDYPTDVLAFPMTEDGAEGDDAYVMGDVVICPEIADENAKKLGHDLQSELDTLLVHGTLHLLGYDHQGPDDKARMEGRLTEVLRTFRSEEDA
ncbi:MAG: rRNA maturation RNase YbeY [Actinomycetota bacterium]